MGESGGVDKFGLKELSGFCLYLTICPTTVTHGQPLRSCIIALASEMRRHSPTKPVCLNKKCEDWRSGEHPRLPHPHILPHTDIQRIEILRMRETSRLQSPQFCPVSPPLGSSYCSGIISHDQQRPWRKCNGFNCVLVTSSKWPKLQVVWKTFSLQKLSKTGPRTVLGTVPLSPCTLTDSRYSPGCLCINIYNMSINGRAKSH